MARLFNGTSDRIHLANPTQFDPAGLSMTVACWAKITTGTAQGFINRTLSSGFRGWSFSYNSSNLRFSKMGVVDDDSAVTMTTGVWAYVAAVVQATQVHFVKVLADGTITTGNVADSAAFNNSGTNTSNMGMMNFNSTSVNWLNGRMAEVSIWMAQLTDSQLRAAAFGGPFASGIKPVYYAPLLGDSPEPDYSGGRWTSQALSFGTTVVAHPPVKLRDRVAGFPVAAPPAAGNIAAPFIAATGAAYAPTLAGEAVGPLKGQSASISVG